MRQNDRMEIDELLYHMTTRTGDRKPKKNLRTHIEKLQRITVHDFYDMPFTMRSKGFVEAIGISRDSVRAVFDGRKEGLFRILESCISQLMPGQSIKTLTMKTLANAISEALEDESLPLGKRMEWYELCFVLVEEMDTSIDGADILTGALTDGGEKPGARLNWGAPGLSRRVEECRSKGKGSAGKKRRRPLGIEDLLKTMNAGKDRLPSDFFLMDMDVVENAITFDERSKSTLSETMQNITGVENPNSVMQMKAWLSENGVEAESLGKKDVAKLIDDTDGQVEEALRLRLQLAKSSVKKYQAMQNAVCKDGRAHGMFQFYGANRSGRWAGRLIQLQNLPQNHMPDLSEARAIVKAGDYDTLQLLYDDIPDTLSQLIRTAFVPRPGYKFIVSDFSAIEARVLAFLAGETWRSKVFAEGKDIYCASASQMFGVPVEKHGINGHLRQKGKIAELALGYGGSVGALKSMGALEMGLTEEELQPLVNSWRSSNPMITAFWWDIDRAVKTTITQRIQTEVRRIRLFYKSGMLFIKLPSGRLLSYVKPRIGENQYGGESVTYEGVGSTKKWERIESYGPKFVENIVQAVSRDILCYAMKTLRHCFIVGHVHDELIIECSPDVDLNVICKQLGRSPEWLPDILLRADGYETNFYKKD